MTSFGPSPGYRNPTSDRPRGWRTYAEFGGGPMRDWGAHLFDQAVQIAGPAPLSVFADVQYRRDWDVETAGMAWLRYGPGGGARRSPGGPEGLRYGIETGSISALPKPRWFVRGSEGAYLQYGRDAQEAALHRGEVGPRVMDAEYAPKVVRYLEGEVREVAVEQVPGDYGEYYRNVGAAIRGESPLAVEPENVLHSIRLLLAAFRSAEQGAPLEGADWQPRQTREGRPDPSLPVKSKSRSRGTSTSCAMTPGPPAPASRPARATTCCSSPCTRREWNSAVDVILPPAGPEGVGAGGYGAGNPDPVPLPQPGAGRAGTPSRGRRTGWTSTRRRWGITSTAWWRRPPGR